jgi:uncharacterized membrane protein YphA (DoxX/SURF4 family)
MKPKTRNTLITGVALLVFGPVLGWVLTIAGFFKVQQSILHTPPGMIPDMGQTASHMFVSLIPIAIGMLCGAVGFFLILYAFITHFFRSANDANDNPNPFDDHV